MSTNGETDGVAERPIRAGVGSFGGEHPKADYFFWWFVTRRCNNHCRHCLRLGIGDRGEELDAAQARRLLLEFVDWLRQNGKTASIAFGGADPCCREDLPDLLRICKDAIDEGLVVRPIGILANAHGMTAEYAQMMFDSGVRSFTISMDGLEAANDAQRGPGDFRESVRAIPILRALRDHGRRRIPSEPPRPRARPLARGLNRRTDVPPAYSVKTITASAAS